jgi:hypothetical protein
MPLGVMKYKNLFKTVGWSLFTGFTVWESTFFLILFGTNAYTGVSHSLMVLLS